MSLMLAIIEIPDGMDSVSLEGVEASVRNALPMNYEGGKAWQNVIKSVEFEHLMPGIRKGHLLRALVPLIEG